LFYEGIGLFFELASGNTGNGKHGNGKKQVWRPMFKLEVFRKQMYCIEESTCDIVWTFWLPHNDSAPGQLCSPPLLGTTLLGCYICCNILCLISPIVKSGA